MQSSFSSLRHTFGHLLAVVCSLILCFHSFAYQETQGGIYDSRYGWIDYIWEYSLAGDGAVITKCTSSIDAMVSQMAEVIPTHFGGRPVVGIGSCAFWGCSGCTNLPIPRTVKEIGDGAFGYCGSSSSLRIIEIPDSVLSIGNQAFYGCSQTETIIIGNGVTNIGAAAFADCRKVNDLYFGDNVKTIGIRAFEHVHDWDVGPLCVHVKDIASWCKIDFAGAASYYLSYSTNPLQNRPGGTRLVVNGKTVTDLMVPEGVERIPAGCFYYYTNLTSVTLPSSMKAIGSHAFEGCTNIKRIGIADIPSWCALNFTLRIPHEMFLNGDRLVNMDISNVPVVNGFSYCTSLESVSISKCGSIKAENSSTYKYVYGDFAKCPNLKTVAINEVGDIGGFQVCPSLETVCLGSGVTNINLCAFSNCDSLKSIIIGKDVTVICGGAFCNLPALEKVVFLGPPPIWENHYFDSPFTSLSGNAVGYYDAQFADQWNAVIQNGKWYELTMRERGTAPEISTVPVADWADPLAGQMRIAWNGDFAKALPGTTYSVWRGVGATRSDAVQIASGVTGTNFTDATFYDAEPIGAPLNYWVVADNPRFSDSSDDEAQAYADFRESTRLETRHRFGLFVGVDAFKPGFGGTTEAYEQHGNNERDAHELLVRHGGFAAANCRLRTGREGDAKLERVRADMRELAALAKPGDLFLLSVSTHGGKNGDSASLMLFDDYYKNDDLDEDLKSFDGCVAIAAVVNACHSGAFDSSAPGAGEMRWTPSRGYCALNIGWLTSAGAEENSRTIVGWDHSLFKRLLLDAGWEDGYAGEKGRVGEPVSLLELGQYAKRMQDGIYGEYVPFGSDSEPEPCRAYVGGVKAVLSRFILPRIVTRPPATLPGAVQSLKPSQNGEGYKDRIVLEWEEVDNAEYYTVYRSIDGTEMLGALAPICPSPYLEDTNTKTMGSASQLYAVRAWNWNGFGPISEKAEGSLDISDHPRPSELFKRTPEDMALAVGENMSTRLDDYVTSTGLIWLVYGLPEGLSVSEDGVISGTPQEAGEYSVFIRAADSEGNVSITGFKLTIFGPTTIILDLKGGLGGTENVTVTYGSAMPTITVPTRTGYTFGGYYTEPDGGGTQYYTATGGSARSWDMTSNTTLYAKWTATETGDPDPPLPPVIAPPSTFTILFSANGGTGSMAAQTIAVGASAKLSANKFTKSGCVFLGWSKTKTGKVAYANGATVKNLAAAGGSVTLYAQWAVSKYAVKFNANGGTLPKSKKMAAQTMTYGKAARLTKNVFTKKGYVFAGWATSAANAKKGIVAYADAQAVKNLRTDGKTTVLYAVWAKPTYKVAFLANGGSGKMATQTFTYGKATKLAANKFKAPKGKTFAGWAKSAADAKAGKVSYKNAQAMKNLVTTGKTVKLYAVWK